MACARSCWRRSSMPRSLRRSACRSRIRARTRSTRRAWRPRWRTRRRRGVTHVIFGDLFLEDVRRYREEKLAGTGIAPVFPLWQRPTDALAREMIDGGVETYLACVDLKQLPIAFAGRRLDHALLAELPAAPIPAARRASSTPSWRPGPMLTRRIAGDGGRRGRARGICVRGFAARAGGGLSRRVTQLRRQAAVATALSCHRLR